MNERNFDRGIDYHYSSSSSKRTNETHARKSSRDRRSNSHEKYGSRNYSRSSPASPPSTSSRVISNTNRKRRARSPSPSRTHSTKRRSRSHSPRPYRPSSPAAYHSRSNQGESSSSSARRSPTARKMDFSSKISDTSLFAELVKDKRKRSQVLQELFDKKDDGPGTSTGQPTNNGNSISYNNSDTFTIDSTGVIVIDSTDNIEHMSDNAKDINDISLGDIPMPNAAGTVAAGANDNSNEIADETVITDAKTDIDSNPSDIKFGMDSVDSAPADSNLKIVQLDAKQISPNPHSGDANDDKTNKNSNANTNTVISVTTESTTTITPATNNSSSSVDMKVIKQIKISPQISQSIPIIKATYTISKPKSLTKLPMPPGVNVNELEDITTPSPPRSASPAVKPVSAAKPNSAAAAAAAAIAASAAATHETSGKKSILDLPMPRMVPGSEDLSGDDDYISSPNVNRKPLSTNPSNKKEVKRKRPVILNRRNSRSQTIKDWGERCVDVFEVIAQIGEGTYGQVNILFHSLPLSISLYMNNRLTFICIFCQFDFCLGIQSTR